MKRISNPSLFKYLMINSLFSQLSGVLLMLLKDDVAAFFEVDAPLVFASIGMVLVVFGVFVYLMTRSFLDNKLIIHSISIMDAGWVIASVILIAMNPWDISTKGLVVIAAIAAWIGFLAYSQYKHNRGTAT